MKSAELRYAEDIAMGSVKAGDPVARFAIHGETV